MLVSLVSAVHIHPGSSPKTNQFTALSETLESVEALAVFIFAIHLIEASEMLTT